MYQATLKVPKINLEGSFMKAIDLIVSAIDQRFNHESFSSYAQMETLLVKTAMVSTIRQSSSFLKHRTAKMLIHGGATWAAKYFGSYVKGGEDIMF